MATRPPPTRADPLSAEAEARLNAVKLRSLASGLVGRDLELPADGNGLVADDRAYCLVDDVHGLGRSLHWTRTNGARGLTLMVEGADAGAAARRASGLDRAAVDVEVLAVDGATVRPVEAAAPLDPPPLDPAHLAVAGLISDAGARPVDDHGMLVAEVAGLEVARVIDGEDGPTLDVGVGQADRELQRYVHGHLGDDENLRRVIAEVLRHRGPGKAFHPLTRVGRQRWLRSTLLDDPTPIGVEELTTLAPLRPRENLLGPEPAAAATPDRSMVVVCSVGIDLDLVPEAVDYRLRENPDADLVLAVPERDRALAADALLSMAPRTSVLSPPLPWE